MITNQFTRNIINVFNKFINKHFRKKLSKYLFNYLDDNDSDDLSYTDLNNIAEDMNSYLNDKLAPLFNNMTSNEFNDSYGSFEVCSIPLFQRYDDDKQFKLTCYDIIDIIDNDPQFNRFSIYLSELIW